jgi:hypothetical protein
LADKRQTNAIIATAILDSIRDYPGDKVDRADAKINAKRILAALEGAGHQIKLDDRS